MLARRRPIAALLCASLLAGAGLPAVAAATYRTPPPAIEAALNAPPIPRRGRPAPAIQGNGGTARLVMLPYEAHGYVGRESVETTLAEMLDWLNRWLGPKRSTSTVR
jgi:hypothetical protein